MLLAHTFGNSGPDVELLLFAAAMFALAVVFFFQKTVKPMVPVVLLLMAFGMGAGAFALGGADSEDPAGAPVSSPATISIVSPADGGEVPAGEMVAVEVAVDGGEVTMDATTEDPTKGHLHVFLDGQLVSMPMGDDVQIEFPEPGTYELTVEFTRTDHASFDPPVDDTIEITAT